MRKISLLTLFVAIVSVANAQWTKVNVPHNDASLLYDVEVPNANTVWASAITFDGTNLIYSNEYLRTADGGATWAKTALQSINGYAISSLYPIDADTCYAAMYNSSAGLGGGIFKTTNGGSSWSQLSKGKIFNSTSFPDFVYFWSASEGMALGDGNGPGDPYFEIYTTTDYGTTWTRTPRENLPATSAPPLGITNSYCVSGNRIWFYAIEGDPLSGPQFIYRSDDKGIHWVAYPLDLPTRLTDFVFTDELNGVAMGIDGAPYLYRTADGGETWAIVNYTGPLNGQFIAAVPGSPTTLVSTNALYIGPNGSSYSYDLGNTWTALDQGTSFLHSDVKFLNATVGWSGQFRTTASQKGGVFQWSGTILPVTFASFTATKATQSVVLNWQTAQESNNAYFAVERSLNGTDFAQIGKVNSKGTSTQPQQYGYEDFGFAKGQNYYRLRQVNTDGKFAYSAVVSVEFTGTQIVRMYPNPVKNVLHVDGLSNTAATIISIVNNAGTVVQKITTTGSTYTFNLQLLPAGNYYLKLENNKKVTTMKFIKQ